MITINCIIIFQEVMDNPSKEEKAVAKYLRFNLTSKEGKLVGMPVQYFIGEFGN